MMHVRSRDLPGGYVLNHSPYRDGFVASEPLAFPGKALEDGRVVSVRAPLWQAMCLMCSMPPPVALSSASSTPPGFSELALRRLFGSGAPGGLCLRS